MRESHCMASNPTPADGSASALFSEAVVAASRIAAATARIAASSVVVVLVAVLTAIPRFPLPLLKHRRLKLTRAFLNRQAEACLSCNVNISARGGRNHDPGKFQRRTDFSPCFPAFTGVRVIARRRVPSAAIPERRGEGQRLDPIDIAGCGGVPWVTARIDNRAPACP